MDETEFSWSIGGLTVALAIVQLLIGFALGALWERRRRQAEDRPELEIRRARKLIQWVCQVLGDTDADDGRTTSSPVSLESMDKICARLEVLEELPTSEVTHLMFDVMNEVVRSNEHLRDELASLRIQLRQQTDEVESHQTQAMTDALTGLPNRRAIDHHLLKQFGEWKALRTPLVFVLLDIDHFKRLNDTYGHAAGDKALRAVAKSLRQAFRATDLVGRFGGEEFAVIMRNCHEAAAAPVICAALEKLAEQSIPCDGISLRVTISAGLVAATDQISVAQLMRAADEALYASKEAGRNCVHAFSPGGCELITRDAPLVEEPELCLATVPADSPREIDALRNALRQKIGQFDPRGE